MSTRILLTGAFHTAVCLRRVVLLLSSLRHYVIASDLTSSSSCSAASTPPTTLAANGFSTAKHPTMSPAHASSLKQPRRSHNQIVSRSVYGEAEDAGGSDPVTSNLNNVHANKRTLVSTKGIS
jgi:hypothetical protein